MFSFLRFIDMPFNFLEFVWNTDQLFLYIVLLHFLKRQSIFYQYDNKTTVPKYMFFIANEIRNSYYQKTDDHVVYKSCLDINQPNTPSSLSNNFLTYNPNSLFVLVPRVTSSQIDIFVSSRGFMIDIESIKKHKLGNKIFYGDSFLPSFNYNCAGLRINK